MSLSPQELLVVGCQKQSLSKVEEALALGAAPEQAGADGVSPSQIAVESWRRQPTPMLKEILLRLGKAGGRAPEIDELLLFEAVDRGDGELVREVLARGLEEEDLNEALRISAILGHLAIVRQLLDAGADPRSDQSSAFLDACQSGQLEVVREFIERGARRDAGEASIGSALDHALMGQEAKNFPDRPYPELIEYLRTLGVRATGIYKDLAEPPDEGAGSAASGAGGDGPEDGDAYPPLGEIDRRLFGALMRGEVDDVGELLSDGADPNARMDPYYEEKLDHDGYAPGKTPLMEACSLDDPAVLGLLLEAGAELDLRDSNGFTALHWAVQEKALAALRALIAAGAALDVKDIEDSTPLHWAAGIGSLDLVRPLVEAGADLRARDYKGETPLSMARLSDDEETVAYLEASLS